MDEISLANAIRIIGRPAFTTREIALVLGTSIPSASHLLRRAQSRGFVGRASRGVWCQPSDPGFSPFGLAMVLSLPKPAYISLLSALHLHGLIEQIPQTIFVATLGRSRTLRTPFGSYSFHRLHPSFFDGFEWYRAGTTFLIALSEKALVDALYLSSRRGKRFRHFPELDVGTGFSFAQARKWARRIPNSRLRTYVMGHLESLARLYRTP